MPPRARLLILRISGVLVTLLGCLHLAVTPHIAHLVQQGSAPGAAAWLTPPMLLNHVVVGIPLLPLGSLTVYAAPHAAAGARWALTVAQVTALTVAALPPTLFLLMGTRYFGAPAFLVAVAIVCVASVVLLLAGFWPQARDTSRVTGAAK